MERNAPKFFRRLNYYINFRNSKSYREGGNSLVNIGDKIKAIPRKRRVTHGTRIKVQKTMYFLCFLTII